METINPTTDLPSNTKPLTPENEKYILDKIEKTCKLWSTMADVLNAGIIILGVTAISTSVLVSIYTGSPELVAPANLKILACISTIALGLLTAFGMVNRSNGARSAWRVLNASLMLYKTGALSMEQLIAQYEKGEKQLGFIHFSNGSNVEQRGINQEELSRQVNGKAKDPEKNVAGMNAKANQKIEEKSETRNDISSTAIDKNFKSGNDSTQDAPGIQAEKPSS